MTRSRHDSTAGGVAPSTCSVVAGASPLETRPALRRGSGTRREHVRKTTPAVSPLAEAAGAAAHLEHLSNLTQEEAAEVGTVVGALIGLGVEGEEGFEPGAKAGAEAASD